jgi:hypothetical protein
MFYFFPLFKQHVVGSFSNALISNTNNTTQEHKKAVKEEKREKRKDKIPKHLKKKLVSTTARHKH